MRLCHQVDAAAHILHRAVGREAYILREAFLGILSGHANGEFDEHMRTPANAVLHKQDFPSALLLKAKRRFQDFGGMALLIEVEHEARQGYQGIGYGAMIVLEGAAVGCPHGQAALQMIVAGFDESAELSQLRLAPCLFPLLSGDRHHGCAMPVAHAGKGGYSLHAASFLAKRRASNRRLRAS